MNVSAVDLSSCNEDRSIFPEVAEVRMARLDRVASIRQYGNESLTPSTASYEFQFHQDLIEHLDLW